MSVILINNSSNSSIFNDVIDTSVNYSVITPIKNSVLMNNNNVESKSKTDDVKSVTNQSKSVSLQEIMKISNNSNTSPIRVVVRFRPLIGDELTRQDKENVRSVHHVKNKLVLKVQAEKKQKDFRGREKPTRLFQGSGFTSIIETKHNNEYTFNTAIAPLIPNVMHGNISSFCYGQTGSGKTHTTLGYGNEKGMYYQAADRITQYLDEVRKIDGLGTVSLSIRFAEMHLKNFYDLLDNRSECFVREDKDGHIHFRSKPLNIQEQEVLYKTSDGGGVCLMDKEYVLERLKIQPLVSICCKNVKDVENVVSKGMKYRQVGTSTIHSQSSRSHAFMEMEIVTDELLKAREHVLEIERELCYCEIAGISNQIFKNTEIKYSEAKDNLKKLTNQLKSLHKCIGGMLIFIDLAGAENGKDIGFENNKKDHRTLQDENEGKSINMSLMSLNDVMRNIHKKSGRISWRGSYLTMAMRKYLQAKNSISTVMCNVSSSVKHEKKTKSTLFYASQMIKK